MDTKAASRIQSVADKNQSQGKPSNKEFASRAQSAAAKNKNIKVIKK